MLLLFDYFCGRDFVMKSITPERPIVIDKPRSACVTLAKFTILQLLCNARGSGNVESAD
jgi:hypothetical protein